MAWRTGYKRKMRDMLQRWRNIQHMAGHRQAAITLVLGVAVVVLAGLALTLGPGGAAKPTSALSTAVQVSSLKLSSPTAKAITMKATPFPNRMAGSSVQKNEQQPVSNRSVAAPTVVATPAVAPVPAEARTGVMTDDNVNMRTGPSTTSPIIAQLPVDARVQVLAQQPGWYRVATAWNSDGWISSDFFKLEPISATVAGNTSRIGSANVIDGPLPLRAGAGANYPSVETLSEETLLDILTLQGDWYQARTPSGTVGWVAAKSVALDWVPDIYTKPDGATADATANQVVQTAQQYLGARYVWGGEDPSGFDCSGFTKYVYATIGVSLPRTSREQFDSTYGQVISSIDALVPGDLVFFERTTAADGITHIGIYVGNGKMIAARSERLGVRYVGLYEPFWNSRFVGGLRPYR